MSDRYHHVFDMEDKNPTNPCPFCDKGGLHMCSVDFSKGCKVCSGNGWYYRATGGGTEPQPEGSPRVYGMRLDRTTCDSCLTVSVQCNYCGHVLTGPVVRNTPPSPRKTHAEAMALLPEEWTILSSRDEGQTSNVRFAVYEERTGKVGMGHAEFWREPDIDEDGVKSPHPLRDEEWQVDPESGFGLTLSEASVVLKLLQEVGK